MATDPETPGKTDADLSRRRPWRAGAWVLLPVAIILAVFSDALTNSRVFFIRDMSFLFWPIHRWYGTTVWNGVSPLWDPYIGFGQPVVGDAVRQMLFPPVAALRLLLPDALGFNLSIVLAVVLACIGAFALARRRHSAEAAAFAATVFALSGTIMSGGNLLTTLWSWALIPWTVWAADRIAERPTLRRCALLSALFALQVLAGEPVSLASGVALTFGFAICGRTSDDLRERFVVVGSVMASGLAGLALSAAQLIPLADAARRSARGIEGVPDILASHPIAFVEAIVGPVFGDPLAPWTEPQPWLAAMNDGSDPYVLSLYVGAPVLVLAVLGMLSGGDRRWRMFWTFAVFAGVVCSVGRFTFVYPLLQKVIPALESFRYPSKYTAVVALSIALLAAGGWEALASSTLDKRAWRAAVGVALFLACVGAVVWILCVVAHANVEDSIRALGVWMAVASPESAAPPVIDALHGSMRELALVGALSGATIVASVALRSRWSNGASLARFALGAMATVCLIGHNGSLNPMLDVDQLRSPAWVEATRSHPADRVFAPGRIAHAVGRSFEPGIPRRADPPPGLSRMAVEAILNEAFGVFPGVNRTREGISIDVTQLWSREYAKGLRMFGWNSASRKALFLERTGTRFVIDRERPSRDAVELHAFEDYAVSLYEVAPPLPRAFVVASSVVVANPDVQTERLFDPSFDPRVAVMLERDAPTPAGRPSTPASEPAAEILEDGSTSVIVRATVPDPDGFLVLHDSWDPHWTVTVDGETAEVVRANGLFRAVSLSPGEHIVRFDYRPTPFHAGLTVTSLTALIVLLLAASRLGRRPLYTRPHGEEAV